MRQTKKQLFWEIFRFLLVGGTATVVDYFIYYLFREWILPPELFVSGAWDTCSLILSTALGFCVGLTVNWILSVRFVFLDVTDKEKSSSKKSFAVFALIGLVGLGITEIGMNVLVNVLPTFALFGVESFLGLPWCEWLAKVMMTCIVLVWNYIARKRLVFR